MEEPFGTILGFIETIPVYSCNYNNINSIYFFNSYIPGKIINFDHYNINNIYYGVKYQCVELIRRWLIHRYNLTFPNINTAYDMFDLSYLINIYTNEQVKWISVNNCSNIKPIIGSIIIWDKKGIFKQTGHLAIIINIIDNYIYIVEQNNENIKWSVKSPWSRKLLLTFNNNIYTIHDKNEYILGWKKIPLSN